MADIKLKLTVEGAAAAKKAIDDVNKSVEDGGRAAEKSSAATESAASKEIAVHEKRGKAIKEVKDAEESAAKAIEAGARATEQSAGAASAEGRARAGVFETVRAQNEAMRETTRALVERMQAERAAKGATDNDTESLSALEKQAKRAADAVERLALAKGKSAEVANALGDKTFQAVASGAVSPGDAVWNVRAGFASEARDAKEAMASLNREARQAEGAWAAAGRGAAGAKASYAEFGRTARGIAEALLPNILVSRSIAAAGALKAVLVGLGAAGSAVAGIFAGAGVGAWIVWKHYADMATESAKRYIATLRNLDEGLRTSEREQRSFTRAGVELGSAEKAWKGVASAAEESARAIAAANSATRDAFADAERMLELKRKSAEVDIEQAAENKLAKASTPEERENILRDRDRRISSLRAKDSVERAALAVSSLNFEEERIREAQAANARNATDAERKSSLAAADVAERENYVRSRISMRLGQPGYGVENLLGDQNKALDAAKQAEANAKKEEDDDAEMAAAEEIHRIMANIMRLNELKAAYANSKAASASAAAAIEARDRNDAAAQERLNVIERERPHAVASLELAEKQRRLDASRQANSDAELNRKQQERADKVAARADKAAAKGERQSEAEVLGDRAVRGVSSVNAREASNSDRGRREIAATAERVRAAGAALHDADGATAKDLIELSAALRDFGKLLERGPKAGLNAGIAELRREIDQLKSQLRETRN